MTARTKITAYIPPDLADSLRRVAAIKDRSISDMVEDAIAHSFSNAGREAEQVALMTRLDRLQHRLGVIERSQEVLFELTAHAARFTMSMAPDISETNRAIYNARGSERLANVIAAIIARIGSGRSLWRDRFARTTPPEGAMPAREEAGSDDEAARQVKAGAQ